MSQQKPDPPMAQARAEREKKHGYAWTANNPDAVMRRANEIQREREAKEAAQKGLSEFMRCKGK